MHFHSTELLQMIDQHGCHVVYERGAPATRLKRDMIWLCADSGQALSLSSQGRTVFPVELAPQMFTDYLAASFLKPDGPEDDEGRTIYRLTTDGRKAARANLTSQ